MRDRAMTQKGVKSKRHSANGLKQALFAFWMLSFAFSDARSGDDAKRGEVEASFSLLSQAGAVCILHFEFCITVI
jgi:uncharacterized membrane protein